MHKPTPGYEKKYVDKAKSLDVEYCTPFEKLRGLMDGKSYKEVIDYFERIKPCTCGGSPRVREVSGMGDLDITISCKSCGRSVCQSIYDRESSSDPSCEEMALKKWNAGMTQQEIDQIREEKWEKKRLHEEDLIWKPVYPNNMSSNPIDGLFCLLFKKTDSGIYACKWTIQYQHKEIEPMLISCDAPIEAYILHMKRYFEVKGPLEYPNPSKDGLLDNLRRSDKRTFNNSDVNSYGDFERAYSTLEDAKKGALARCGWQGLNRETIIKKKK